MYKTKLVTVRDKIKSERRRMNGVMKYIVVYVAHSVLNVPSLEASCDNDKNRKSGGSENAR